MSGWHPVAASADMPRGHIYRTMLDGLGLALWRNREGRLAVWEDRCPHRGLRFSMGAVIGDELRCQYHAWRFAADGRCTKIPAHPDMKVPSTVHARVLPAIEQDGLVWASLDPRDDAPPRVMGIVLRAFAIKRDAAEVRSALDGPAFAGARLFAQPVAAGRCVVRGTAPAPRRRELDGELETLRVVLEGAG